MNLADQKKAARSAASLRRREAHAALGKAASTILCEHLSGLSGKRIAGYLPIRTEADPTPAMRMLAPNNHMCVPVVAGPGLPLIFREWSPEAPQQEGTFGVMVPEKGADIVPEILIVPLLAFDSSGFRLGYGGGFYDRTLEALRSSGSIRAIGFAYSAQHAETLPLEPTDQQLDDVLTERGLF